MSVLIRSSSVLMCAAAMVGLAHAQTAPATSPDQSSEASNVLEEIVITAQHRETDVQKTAAALTVLQSDSLRESGLDNMNDALRTVSGAQVRDDPSGSVVVVRGIQPVFNTDPSVSINVDGVYQLIPGSLPTYDLARVEVLKGPQGTEYGRNALGGVANFVNRMAGDKFGGYVALRAGNYDARRLEAAVDIPLSDQFATRTAMLMSERDGYLSNGNMDEDIRAIRETVSWMPTENLKFLLTGEFDQFGGQGLGSVPAPLSSHSSDPWFDNTNPAAQDSTNEFANLRVNWDLGGARLMVQTAWQKYHTRVDQNLQDLGFGVAGNYNSTISAEVRLASSADAPVQWGIGAYHLDTEIDNVGVPEPLIPSEPHNFGATAVGALNTTKSDAIFGNLTYPLSDALRINAGLRYTVDDKTLDTRVYDPSSGAQINSIVVSKNFPALTYQLGLEYDVSGSSMLYATLSRGFKSGGLNVPGQTPAVYDPEFINAFALGLKNEFFGRTVRANFDAFYYDNPDKQVQTVGPCNPASPVSSCPFPETTNFNSSAATIYGAELQTSWLVTPGDLIHVNVAYTHSRFDKLLFNVVTLVGFPPTVTVTTIDRSGDQLPNAPLWSGDVGYEHIFTLPNGGELKPNVNMQFSSGYDSDINYNFADQRQPSYQTVNAELLYTSPDKAWTLGAYVNNIDNVAVRQRAFPGNRLFLANPLTAGVTLSVNF